ncbi:hypothetical protein C8J57DRAFT_1517163 [Mycena rebaudengoi]|nr:hypothetical protein C8J57DRAFT_1517163 [Mycena rebaudengoi]
MQSWCNTIPHTAPVELDRAHRAPSGVPPPLLAPVALTSDAAKLTANHLQAASRSSHGIALEQRWVLLEEWPLLFVSSASASASAPTSPKTIETRSENRKSCVLSLLRILPGRWHLQTLAHHGESRGE